jgi:hypothetical protein
MTTPRLCCSPSSLLQSLEEPRETDRSLYRLPIFVDVPRNQRVINAGVLNSIGRDLSGMMGLFANAFLDQTGE